MSMSSRKGRTLFEVVEAGFRFGGPAGGGEWLFRDVSFAIEAGAVVALMGPSGCGKTTLLHGLSGIGHLSEGQGVLDGIQISNLPQRKVRKNLRESVSMIFQDHLLIPGLSLLENVELSWSMAGRPSGALPGEMLDRLAVGGERNSLPEAVSGGQAQRAAIARALAAEPRILFADEPTGSLDEGNASRAIKEITERVRSSQAHGLIVTHDAAIADLCDRTILLGGGSING